MSLLLYIKRKAAFLLDNSVSDLGNPRCLYFYAVSWDKYPKKDRSVFSFIPRSLCEGPLFVCVLGIHDQVLLIKTIKISYFVKVGKQLALYE